MPLGLEKAERILDMGSRSHVSTRQIISEEGLPYFLLLWTLRGVLEKYGGSMKKDQNSNTVILSIPPGEKAACCEELEVMINLIKPFVRLLPSHN